DKCRKVRALARDFVYSLSGFFESRSFTLNCNSDILDDRVKHRYCELSGKARPVADFTGVPVWRSIR
ncbi:hypothetical protein, partial [Lacrimispora sp. 210928-DFI.3.58]|uniref:hypothetical protein n=1 Tax=Lacrimispora sp. 210928-DFI.3.58 TaxID=2883214 RepID=UPI001D082F3F